MAKFSFNDSQFYRFWDSRDASDALRLFVNDPEIIKQGTPFWKRFFPPDSMLTTRNYDGTANFTALCKVSEVNNMLDMRAPLTETLPRDTHGFEAYQGPIPDFSAKGYVEDALKRENRRRMFEEYYGSDAELLNDFANIIQDMVTEANMSISNMAAQVMTTGEITYNHGNGIKGKLYKVPIPEPNFIKGGQRAWTDPEATILTDMHNIEQAFRDRATYSGPMEWVFSMDFFRNTFLKNKEVISYVSDWRTLNEKVTVSGMPVSVEMFTEAFASNDIISPVVVAYESAIDGEHGVVHGWKRDTVVYKPRGAAGTLKRAAIQEQRMSTTEYRSSILNEVFAQMDVFTIRNRVVNESVYKKWHTDLLVAAIPVLEEWPYHLIVDISEGNGVRG